MTSFVKRVAEKVAVKLIIGAVTFGAGVYAAVELFGPEKKAKVNICHDEHLGGYISLDQSRAVHDQLAPKYDRLVSTDEKVAGVLELRKKLGNLAAGRVLEVAIGSGRNFPYYGDKVTEITGVDYSEEMMKQSMAKEKKVKTRLLSSDVHYLSSLFPDERFDTVVDTFGLCSFENPIKVLQEMQKVCKPDGQIFLLEHGLSSSSWLRSYMDSRAHSHATSWACFYNRDINKLVEESGLIVTHSERKFLGTTYFIIAKPSAQFTTPGVIQQTAIETSSLADTSASQLDIDPKSSKFGLFFKKPIQNDKEQPKM